MNMWQNLFHQKERHKKELEYENQEEGGTLVEGLWKWKEGGGRDRERERAS